MKSKKLIVKKLCVIPARGGSKRIPKKNIKSFCGKPIIYFSISIALKSKLFDEVMVSTDDEEIKNIAIKYGATVPFFRSEKASNDHATTFDVIEEVITKFKQQNKIFDFVCCLYSCAPFTTENNLKLAFNLLKEKRFDSIFPIFENAASLERSLEITGNKIKFKYPEFMMSRSQDFKKYYSDAGQFYFLNNEICLLKKNIITDNSGFIILNELEVQDIDNEIDWKLAELKYEYLQSIK